MKYLVALSRIFVGVLFIISGLIKLNDPLGFSYKLQEYFSVDVLNIPFLEPYALMISVLVVVFEVVLGVFLLIGYKPKFTVWSLLLMIVFFSFLTFYSAYFDKVKDCGCFGDALKLTPWESFTKDIVLLFFILILFFGVKHIKPIFNKLGTTVLALLSFILSFWFGYYVLMHLPAKDFRAYKIGANIQEGMRIPEDAAKPVVEYYWKFKVNGEEKVITTDGAYPTVNGDFISVDTKMIDEGYQPPIVDFSIETEDEDLTQQFLSEDKLIMIVSYSLEKIEKQGVEKLKAFSDEAIKKGYTVIGLTASGGEAKQKIKNAYNLNFNFYLCDEKALKTVVRSNPGILELHKGTIKQKVHWNDIDDLKLESFSNANLNLNLDLKRQLDSIMVFDQKYRKDWETYDKHDLEQSVIDSTNLVFIDNVLKKYGYPGKSLVGENTNEVAFYVIQHSFNISKYLPLIKEAGKKGELPLTRAAMMEDRFLLHQGKKQIYGTQGFTLNARSPNPINIIWPIQDLESVDKKRKEAGFDMTVEENGKHLFGENFKFKNYSLDEIKHLEKENLWILDLLKEVS